MNADRGKAARSPGVESFRWTRTAELLSELLEDEELVLGTKGRCYVSAEAAAEPRVEFQPPLVQAPGALPSQPREYLDSLETGLGLHLVLLIQAGAAALGLWEDDTLLRHKALKRYVVRGRGRAQPLHAKTRGKSRYGSRLRLRNAQRLLVDVGERLEQWWDDHGPPRRLYVSCPVRTWPELWKVTPPPPFAPRDPLVTRIPLHVHVPDFAELERVREALARGRVLRRPLRDGSDA